MKISQDIMVGGVMLACAVVLAFAIGGWAWMGIQVYEARGDVAQRITDRDAARAKGEYSETLRFLIRDTVSERGELAAFTNTHAIEVVRKLQEAADAAGVDLSIDAIAPTSIAVGTVKKVPAFSVAISSAGSFARLYGLLTLLSELPLPIILDEASLEQEGSGTGGWTLRARLLLYTEAAQ